MTVAVTGAAPRRAGLGVAVLAGLVGAACTSVAPGDDAGRVADAADPTTVTVDHKASLRRGPTPVDDAPVARLREFGERLARGELDPDELLAP